MHKMTVPTPETWECLNRFMSANEAREKTLKRINEGTTKELIMLQKMINDAISDGRYSISNEGSLQFATSERLKELGYRVTTGSQYNQEYYTISWK